VSATYLSCKELVELVTDYFEDALSSSDKLRFEEHIMTCPPCRAHLEQMRGTLRVVGHVPEDSVPPDVERSLVEAFRGWKRGD
jgi:predicted anti-sigma-YlaC factor YlaD